MPTTVALRFRDFGNDTITDHKAIIDEHHYVWWGWWARRQEQPPRDVLVGFKDRIEADEAIDLHLVDSGRIRLFRVETTDIRVTDSSQPIASPEPDRTPTYYNARLWPVWFKFRKIEELQPALIRDFSYDEVADFTNDPYQAEYHGKRVFDLDEMLDRRHRTIYFLRPAVEEDRDEHVKLLVGDRLSGFVTLPRHAHGNFIVQLSDLHFSSEQHGFPPYSRDLAPDLQTRIRADITTIYGDAAPAAVILSGDLTWRGSSEEYEYARQFVSELRSGWALEPDDFIVIPGNHDIQWAEQDSGYDPKHAVTLAPGDAEANYREFIKTALGFPAEPTLAMGRRVLLGNFIPLDIVALNSCRLEQQHFAGYGYVGLDQLEHAIDQMGWRAGPPDGPLVRLLVLHHHVLPVNAVEEVKTVGLRYSLTLDAGQLLYRALDLGVDLVMHGHQHQPFAASFGRTVPEQPGWGPTKLAVHGAGSAGVKRDHTGLIGKNSYTIFEFEAGRLAVHVRASSNDQQAFQSYGDYTIDLPQRPRTTA
jgi:3',5'-cyclic AMP phosphodiesterase CpdA